MIDIRINQQPILLDAEFKFKLILDNPFFTKSSAYTRDIKIPMRSNVNKRVFGNISRQDIAKNTTNYDVELIIDNKINLTGKAILRNVTNEDVTIQCVFENSQFNYLNKLGDNKYIDELTSYYNKPMRWKFLTQIDLSEQNVQDILGPYPNISWNWNPVYNASAEEVYNKAYGRPYKGGNTILYRVFDRRFAPQPYLGYVFSVICDAADVWHLGQEWLTETFGQLYIVNSTVTESLLDILPHWTFGEFFDEVEKLTGGVIIVEENKRLQIVPGNEYYTEFAPRKFLKVIDKYKVELDEESMELDISTANLGYKLVSSEKELYRRVDDSLLDFKDKFNRDRKLYYDNISAMNADIERIYNNSKKEVEYYVYITAGRYYYVRLTDKSYVVEEFNRYRDIVKDNKSDNKIELKIVPAAMMTFEAGVNDEFSIGTIRWRAPARCPVSQGDVYNLPEEPTILDLLENGKQEVFKKDVIEIAYNNITTEQDYFEDITGPKGQKMPYPSAFCDTTEEITTGNLLPKKFKKSLRLHGEDGVQAIGDNFNRDYKIDRRIEYRFEFLSRDILNIRDVFVVGCHEYVAKKIEVEISQDGITPLQTGVFYLLDK